MGVTKIQYVDYSWSGWRSCEHARMADGSEHSGCLHCFAEAASKRNPKVLGRWGAEGTRVLAAPAYWQKPLAWDRQAYDRQCYYSATRTDDPPRPRILWDLSDPFEDWSGVESDGVTPRCMSDHRGNRLCTRVGTEREVQWPDGSGWRPLTMLDVRQDAFSLIDQTPNLTWLLLTKRPQNIRRMWTTCQSGREYSEGRLVNFRENCWLGCSVSDQQTADEAIPHLLACGDLAPVMFLSVEPLLGPVVLPSLGFTGPKTMPDWVIVGGESGPNARPCEVAWIRDIVRQCRMAEIPCYVKQLGSQPIEPDSSGFVKHMMLGHPKGGAPEEWPEDLLVREFPSQ